MLISVASAVTWSHGDIRAQAAAWSHIWVGGPAEAGVLGVAMAPVATTEGSVDARV